MASFAGTGFDAAAALVADIHESRCAAASNVSSQQPQHPPASKSEDDSDSDISETDEDYADLVCSICSEKFSATVNKRKPRSVPSCPAFHAYCTNCISWMLDAISQNNNSDRRNPPRKFSCPGCGIYPDKILTTINDFPIFIPVCKALEKRKKQRALLAKKSLTSSSSSSASFPFDGTGDAASASVAPTAQPPGSIIPPPLPAHMYCSKHPHMLADRYCARMSPPGRFSGREGCARGICALCFSDAGNGCHKHAAKYCNTLEEMKARIRSLIGEEQQHRSANVSGSATYSRIFSAKDAIESRYVDDMKRATEYFSMMEALIVERRAHVFGLINRHADNRAQLLERLDSAVRTVERNCENSRLIVEQARHVLNPATKASPEELYRTVTLVYKANELMKIGENVIKDGLSAKTTISLSKDDDKNFELLLPENILRRITETIDAKCTHLEQWKTYSAGSCEPLLVPLEPTSAAAAAAEPAVVSAAVAAMPSEKQRADLTTSERNDDEVPVAIVSYRSTDGTVSHRLLTKTSALSSRHSERDNKGRVFNLSTANEILRLIPHLPSRDISDGSTLVWNQSPSSSVRRLAFKSPSSESQSIVPTGRLAFAFGIPGPSTGIRVSHSALSTNAANALLTRQFAEKINEVKEKLTGRTTITDWLSPPVSFSFGLGSDSSLSTSAALAASPAAAAAAYSDSDVVFWRGHAESIEPLYDVFDEEGDEYYSGVREPSASAASASDPSKYLPIEDITAESIQARYDEWLASEAFTPKIAYFGSRLEQPVQSTIILPSGKTKTTFYFYTETPKPSEVVTERLRASANLKRMLRHICIGKLKAMFTPCNFETLDGRWPTMGICSAQTISVCENASLKITTSVYLFSIDQPPSGEGHSRQPDPRRFARQLRIDAQYSDGDYQLEQVAFFKNGKNQLWQLAATAKDPASFQRFTIGYDDDPTSVYYLPVCIIPLSGNVTTFSPVPLGDACWAEKVSYAELLKTAEIRGPAGITERRGGCWFSGLNDIVNITKAPIAASKFLFHLSVGVEQKRSHFLMESAYDGHMPMAEFVGKRYLEPYIAFATPEAIFMIQPKLESWNHRMKINRWNDIIPSSTPESIVFAGNYAFVLYRRGTNLHSGDPDATFIRVARIGSVSRSGGESEIQFSEVLSFKDDILNGLALGRLFSTHTDEYPIHIFGIGGYSTNATHLGIITNLGIYEIGVGPEIFADDGKLYD